MARDCSLVPKPFGHGSGNETAQISYKYIVRLSVRRRFTAEVLFSEIQVSCKDASYSFVLLLLVNNIMITSDVLVESHLFTCTGLQEAAG